MSGCMPVGSSRQPKSLAQHAARSRYPVDQTLFGAHEAALGRRLHLEHVGGELVRETDGVELDVGGASAAQRGEQVFDAAAWPQLLVDDRVFELEAGDLVGAALSRPSARATRRAVAQASKRAARPAA